MERKRWTSVLTAFSVLVSHVRRKMRQTTHKGYSMKLYHAVF